MRLARVVNDAVVVVVQAVGGCAAGHVRRIATTLPL